MKNFSFVKAEALSNDFVIIDDRSIGSISFSTNEIIRICDRRTGIGADGILLLGPSDAGDFKMRTLNSDGSEAEMCGNGIRCAAAYVYASDAQALAAYTIDTLAGLKNVRIIDDERGLIVSVDLGEPVFNNGTATINVDGRAIELTEVSMGNPHAVIFVEDAAATQVETLGPVIETDKIFPDRTNVEFIQIAGNDLIIMRVWERGAGETAACGTGAAAALAVASRAGKTGRKVTVRLSGGDLAVEWADDGHLFITGEANMVFAGTMGED